MNDIIASGLKWYVDHNDPAYKAQREKYRKMYQEYQSQSSAALCASVGAGVLGLACSSSLIRVPLLMIALPVGYLSYNANKFFGNVSEFNDNPFKYFSLKTLCDKPSIDREAFRRLLQKDTVCFDWAIDSYLDSISDSLDS